MLGEDPGSDKAQEVADRGLHLMSAEQFEQAADFIDAAVAAGARTVEPELHRERMTAKGENGHG